jgi:hypothetical protein
MVETTTGCARGAGVVIIGGLDRGLIGELTRM